MNQIPLTATGAERLRQELKDLQYIKRPLVIEAIAVARDHGDLKENAEYHAAKEEQGKLAGRIGYLEGRISRAQIIDPAKTRSDRVGFGATVVVCDAATDKETIYALVGEDESDADNGRISITAPLARALLGKQEGDEVLLRLPKGDRELEIVSVEYKALE